ncbi:MAG TPA: YidC/Oxa1 family membrane protein insertase, partial [Chloroflexota bacterium]|nr:YidC/Oxa1 family membrane protein insertase [Chloroflexota bacterium]
MLVAANIFQPLMTVFEAVLKFFHNSVGVPWGWSIVLLTILIRAILMPLTIKQFHSMQKLQRVAPELKKIQAKYKEDKQRQQQEMMKLYQEHGVNPFGSCLPLVAQLPVFISLYYMLRQSLRPDICPTIQPGYSQTLHKVVSMAHTKACGSHGASFLFIHDLTDKATGGVLIALIILYVGSQLGSQLLMSTPQMDKTQRNMMLLLPLFFVI